MASNYAFTDFFKNSGDMFKNTLNFNQLFSTQRSNIEAISAANQAIVEGAQAISRRQAEVIRSNVEDTLKASKAIMTSGTPESNLSKQAELARSIFENTLANLREISETAMKSGFEAFDVLNKRMAESIEEIGSASASAASSSKKKNAA